MGKEQTAEWYDKVYSTKERRYRHPPEKLPWFPVWSWLAERVTTDHVYDLGCGGGHFLHVLEDQGWSGSYKGYDYSSVVIDMAINLNRDTKVKYVFSVADIFNLELDNVGTYVLTEVLEHIEDDLSILEKIPSGSQVLISCPSFDSRGHVRHFNTIAEFVDRYSSVLDFLETHSHKGVHYTWCASCMRK